MIKEDIVYLITFFRNAKDQDLKKIFGTSDINKIAKDNDVNDILKMVKKYVRDLYDMRKGDIK